jgi:hypothetical protein
MQDIPKFFMGVLWWKKGGPRPKKKPAKTIGSTNGIKLPDGDVPLMKY